jgi:glycine/sarcosine N-methyltransferase
VTEQPSQGITGDLSKLYDVFVDWPGRLEREIPGIDRHLKSVRARRVLDAGCGTGQHVKALRERGFDVHGADLSPDMLVQAAALLGGPTGLHPWRMGEAPPPSLRAAAPFDALICMGNVWPGLAREAEARAAAATFRELLRPGGLVLFGLKAVAVRIASGDPYMPLLRREHQGRSLWFVRFVELGIPALTDGTRTAEFHMVVVAGDAAAGPDGAQALIHRVSRVRAWDPAELGAWFAERGFEDVRVSGSLGDPDVPPRGEDVFVSMRTPAQRAEPSRPPK